MSICPLRSHVATARVPAADPACARWLAAWLLVGVVTLAPTIAADDLDDAFGKLVEGRAYLKDFPDLKTRNQLVDDFVGANGQSLNRPALTDAISRAVTIRYSEQPEPDSESAT